MRRPLHKILVALVGVVLASAMLSGCSRESGSERTLTYWASNQGASVQHDYEVLEPELAKFEHQTGISVDLQVIGWSDLLNRLLSAIVSGTGPDVINIGNTWSVSLQATGGLVPFDNANAAAIGGLDKFLDSSLSASGAPGEVPTSVPLYGLAYGLFYNKQMFAEAGIEPPRNWEEFDAAAEHFTDPAANRYGVALAGASYTENAHFAFILAQQHGGEFFTADGKPQFTRPATVDAISQYVDLLATQQVASPSSAQFSTTNDAATEFSSGRAAMFMAQNNTAATLEAQGMSPDAFGVAPMPILDPLPPGGEAINSHVAGINVAAMKDSDDPEGALELIKFLTSPEEQRILNEEFGSLPVLEQAGGAADPRTAMFREVLATTAKPMPLITNEAEFETTVGNAVRALMGRAATGERVGEQAIEAALDGAEARLHGSTSGS